MRAIVKFQKTGLARFTSHLDLMRAMQRALRRARIPVAYSAGFNPHMQISFATALSLGYESRCELLDVKLSAERTAKDFEQAFAPTLPQGIRVQAVRMVPDTFPSPMNICDRASYLVCVGQDCGEKIKAFLAKDVCLMPKKGKKGVHDVDIRPMVYELDQTTQFGGFDLILTLAHREAMALKPELLLQAMGVEPPYRVIRTGLFALREGQVVDLFEVQE